MALKRDQALALGRLIVETRMLFRELRGATQRVHESDAQTAARRSVLVELVDDGPQTVPAMAEARNVSRQAIQGLANGLADAGLVVREANPAHKRSWLWRATEAGQARVREMRRREHEALLGLRDVPDAAHLRAACDTLVAVREAVAEAGGQADALESDPDRA